ncbi:MAG: hypothetical protein Q8Q55_00120, partial [Undibacterium sp.]|nr:hypothetical protein [Undibacterium sp.]
MKKLIPLIFIVLIDTSFAQPPKQLSVGNQATADRLLSCASAQAANIQILEKMGKDVNSLFREVGLFKLAGEAYSSKTYSETKLVEFRTAIDDELTAALAA